MNFYIVLLASLSAVVCNVNAAVVMGTPTEPAQLLGQAGMITHAAVLPAIDLRRQLANTDDLCGFSDGGGNTWHCITRSLSCGGTIYPDGNAYQYCSDPNVLQQDQVVFTTAVGNWPTSKLCPVASGTQCCYTDVNKAIFTAGPYTVTGWGCGTVETTWTYTPYTRLLDPSAFKISLAEATLSSSSSSNLATSTSSSSPGPSPSVSEPASGGESGSDSAKSSSGSGLSSGTKIGIGAGVGAGVGIVLIAAIIFLCLRRRSKKKKEREIHEVAPAYGKGPTSPYSPPMSYNQSQAQYYQQEPGSPQWSGPQSPATAGYAPAPFPPRELEGRTEFPKTVEAQQRAEMY